MSMLSDALIMQAKVNILTVWNVDMGAALLLPGFAIDW